MKCRLFATAFDVAVNRVVADVGGTAAEPFGERGLREIADLGGWRLPVDQPGLVSPERIAFLDRAVVVVEIGTHAIPPRLIRQITRSATLVRAAAGDIDCIVPPGAFALGLI